MPDTAVDHKLADQLNLALTDAVADGAAAGVTLALATRDGEVFAGAAGRLGLDTQTPAAADSPFWIASFTKLLTAIVALQLASEETLNLDAAAADYVPEIGDIAVVERAGDDFRLRPPASPITVRHLLTHTSGASYAFFNAITRDYAAAHDIPGILALDRRTLFAPLVNDPGTDFEYGAGIDLLGLVIEAATGRQLVELFQERIISPLNLVNTTATPDDSYNSRRLKFHGRGGDSVLAPLDLSIPTEGEFFAGGHALFSTAQDYLRILRALLNGGELDGVRILDEESVRQGFSNQIGELRWHPIVSADPSLTNDVDALGGEPGTWGYFGLINETAGPNGRSAHSTFWAGLANSYWWIDLDHGVAGVIGTQTFPFADPKILALQGIAESALISFSTGNGD
ncbi:MAG: serine hydrolase domain-containing protein [Gordonia sp. (in: high G+C Gram-positive bacteria)]